MTSPDWHHVSNEDLSAFLKANPCVERWLRKYADKTQSEYAPALCRFFQWLKADRGLNATAEEALNMVLKSRQSQNVLERRRWHDFALDFSRYNPAYETLSDSAKHLRYTAVRKFFADHEVPLTSGKGEFGAVRRKFKRPCITLKQENGKGSPTAYDIIKNCKPREQSILLFLLQSGQSIGHILERTNFEWHRLEPQIKEGKDRLRLDYDDRKLNPYPYFTFVSRDAKQALLNYLRDRGTPKADEAIWISASGRAVDRRDVYGALQSVYRKAGIEKVAAKTSNGHTEKIYPFHLQMLRKLFKSISRKCGVDQDFVEFMEGHIAGTKVLSAVGGIYDESPQLFEELVTNEYKKMEDELNILSPRPSDVEIATTAAHIDGIISRLPEDRKKQVLSKILQNYPFRVRKELEKAPTIRNIMVVAKKKES